MDIDIERLKWDAEYWDEVAPEWATHYTIHTNNPWEMHLGHGIFDLRDNRFCKYAKPGEVHMEARIPRPTKPAEPEWDGEGLPPVGCECEYKTEAREGQGNFATNWESCIVKYASENGAFLLDEYKNEIFMDSMDYLIMFRPIRTQVKKKRDRAIAEALRVALHPVDDEIHPRKYLIESLEALYDAGILNGDDHGPE